MYTFNQLDHFDIPDLETVINLLRPHNCQLALIKELPKNANDKNQVYYHSDASLLNSIFDLRFSDRGESTSITKRASEPGKAIPQAIFHRFSWLSTDGILHPAKECKAIVYAQYPEARLSGFVTEKGEMPRSMSVEYIKRDDRLPRYLILGSTLSGHAVAIMAVDPGEVLVKEFRALSSYYGSKVCKSITIQPNGDSGSVKLEKVLRDNVASKTLLGCRFDKNGITIPFTGTQVHGYTLEHACGIKPNAEKNGDIYGIELKCFTRKKLTLFTPEPDGGLYAESFADFMMKYGYQKGEDYRLTGLHRAYVENEKTKLTLKIRCVHSFKDKREDGRSYTRYEPGYYQPEKPITRQMIEMEIVLEDREGNIAASWSLERILNCWGAKHNEVVYVPAEKQCNDEPHTLAEGYKWKVKFADEVLWCRDTNAEKLFKAIHSGTIYLDPAPKYNPSNPKLNKRRSQWRLNDIYKAASELYELSELKRLTN
ncbi:MvaI/BcnI restriction endonuclease family protein [Vibrio alginolyticus]|uniref:MvaI/BcnI family restriction endonuclease n=1 Tax=Vibrio TaxID=662 RepID=UPI001EFD627A|nr:MULTISPECIES: MvaI/BcnI family restriction endonuclease [Vibrio]MCG9718527.1 MvaI/BcnI restriction endonuclease family protein [Vibrio alginolyticus]MDW1872652.1 MvaI/BcnI family restriction endonuclease [Vibrio sp. Vb0598]